MADEEQDDISADDWAAALAEQQAATDVPKAMPAAAVPAAGMFQELKADALTGGAEGDSAEEILQNALKAAKG